MRRSGRREIHLISGTTGAGKSTVARALCAHHDRAVHIETDAIREWVVAGYASPLRWTPDTTQQFAIARRVAGLAAAEYARAGYFVAIDDLVRHSDLASYTEALDGQPLRLVLLRPQLEIALARNAARTNKTFDTSVLAPVARELAPVLARENTAERGWLVIDSTALDVEQTVDAILAA